MARKVVQKGIAFDDDKKLYYVTMDYGKNEAGKRIKETKTFKDIKDAKKELKIFEANKAKGTIVIPTKDTIESYSKHWLEVEKKDLQESTLYGYRNILNKHIIPYFKNKELGKLQRQDMLIYLDHLSEDSGLSSKTIRKHYDLLKSLFTSALYDEKVYKSPLENIRPPKVEEYENDIYNPEQVVSLFKSIEGDRLEIMVKLAVYLGLRRGEVAGLRWDNIDFTKNTISILESRTQVGAKIIAGGVKSDSSERILSIPKGLLPVLEKVKSKQEQDKKDLGDFFKDSRNVVCWDDGSPYRPNYISDLFKEHLKKNGLPHIRFHDLRHTFGSIAVNGTDLRSVSKAMGHSRTEVTEGIYLHDYIPTFSEAVEAVDKILSAEETKENSMIP